MKKVIGLTVVIVVCISLILQYNDSVNTPVENDIAELSIGYIIYPPLLTKDAKTGELSGVSYDIVEAVAVELGLKTNWVEEVGWGTSLTGLNTGRYDVLGTQMWPNEDREKVALFSVAPMDSVIYPYVKSGDDRFMTESLEVINSAEIKISAIDGEMAMFIAREDYPQAQINSLPQLSSYAEVFLNVIQNKTDVTFVEPAAAEDFLAVHPGTIERVGSAPVRKFGNSFAFDKENSKLMEEWNVALLKLAEEGEVEQVLKKYDVESHYLIN